MAKTKVPKAVAGDEAPAKGKLKLIIIIVLAVLLLVGGSVGATWFLLGKGAHKEEASEEKSHEAPAAPPPRAAAIYEQLMPAFVVNYKYEGRTRYMQVSVALMSRDQAAMDALKVHMPMVRNRLVMLFSSQDFEALLSPLGREMLRQQATASVQELAQKETGKPVIEQVLFTNLALQ